MRKVGLVSSEPLRAVMAGIGIRYLELARRLAREGFSVILVHPGTVEETPPAGDGVEVRQFRRGEVARLLAGCEVALAQGQLANDVVIECPEMPLAVDLYDPWLLENLHYEETLGLDPYRNDHATWVLQLSHGDAFLCSCEEQRDFYLGFLTALGRVNPRRTRMDPDLRGLIDVLPFGVPEELPAHDPWLPPARDGAARLLFGGVYDWYDPGVLLDALETLDDLEWRLLLVRNPNPRSTPQAELAGMERRLRRAPAQLQARVEVLDWVPFARRFDLLRDVDLMVATHRDCLETRLALRTRFLEALAVGCPVIASEGGAVSRMLASRDAGWVVPHGDAAALAAALRRALSDPAERDRRAAAGLEVAASFRWSRILAPLVRFLREPVRDPTKQDFVHRPLTKTPPDSWSFRMKRRLRSLVEPGGAR